MLPPDSSVIQAWTVGGQTHGTAVSAKDRPDHWIIVGRDGTPELVGLDLVMNGIESGADVREAIDASAKFFPRAITLVLEGPKPPPAYVAFARLTANGYRVGAVTPDPPLKADEARTLLVESPIELLKLILRGAKWL